MRTLALVLLAAACGGGSASPPPKAPAPEPAAAAPAPAPAPMKRPPDAAPRAEAKVEAAPPPNALAILDRVYEKEGEVPGMAGWKIKRVADTTVCGGTRITVTRTKRKLDADQTAIASVYALAFPADLSFEKKPENEASLKKFSEFVGKLQKTGADATSHFE